MAMMKCKMCGGDLEVTAGMTVAECEYCGSLLGPGAVQIRHRVRGRPCHWKALKFSFAYSSEEGWQGIFEHGYVFIREDTKTHAAYTDLNTHLVLHDNEY